MLDYYEKRLPDYESIYHKPERQHDLGWLEQQLCDLTRGKDVVELACGSGYWSRRIAEVSRSLFATDGSELLARAALASCMAGRVSCGVIDAFNTPSLKSYDVILSGFFYSHILRQQLPDFLRGIAASARSGARIVLFDNRFVTGSSTPLSRTDEAGNTFQARALRDGSQHEVLKNFPDETALKMALQTVCYDIEVCQSQYFWLATGIVRA